MRGAPYLYQLLASRLKDREDPSLKVWEFKQFVGGLLHVPKGSVWILIGELESFGLVRFKKSTQTIEVL